MLMRKIIQMALKRATLKELTDEIQKRDFVKSCFVDIDEEMLMNVYKAEVPEKIVSRQKIKGPLFMIQIED